MLGVAISHPNKPIGISHDYLSVLQFYSLNPPRILRQLPASINKRISTLSSDKQVFDDAVQTYKNALGNSNFSHKLEYMPHVLSNHAGTDNETSFGLTLHSAKCETFSTCENIPSLGDKPKISEPFYNLAKILQY